MYSTAFKFLGRIGSAWDVHVDSKAATRLTGHWAMDMRKYAEEYEESSTGMLSLLPELIRQLPQRSRDPVAE